MSTHQHKPRPELEHSEVIEELPRACCDELAAVEFLEAKRWGDCPCCVHCGSTQVYKMTDATTAARNKRFLWRCRDCRKQYTVRVGTVFEDSRIPLRHWCYAFWAACASKKGVSALQIKRQTGLSYKSALFLMHRIRFAMAPTEDGPKLNGIVEADETYVGGKPRHRMTREQARKGDRPSNEATRRDRKTPVFAMVQRNGQVRARVMPVVTGMTLRQCLLEHVETSSCLMTDESPCYRPIGDTFEGGHHAVNHKEHEYVRGPVTTNTVEGFFANLKRGIIGTFHAVSKKHLQRYVYEFEFRYNARKLNDGQRVIRAIKAADGKRLTYSDYVA